MIALTFRIVRYNVIVKGLTGKPLTINMAILKIVFIYLFSAIWTLAPIFGWLVIYKWHRSLSGNNSRPRTPPAPSCTKETAPISRIHAGPTSPPRRNYTDYLSHTNDDWNAEDEDDEDDEYGYDNDDGDDFGLPSISSIKRKQKRAAEKNSTDPGGGLTPWGTGRSNSGFGTRRLSNSADIAVERPIPSYPIAKKSEGKILRPQYKEILKGLTTVVAAL